MSESLALDSKTKIARDFLGRIEAMFSALPVGFAVALMDSSGTALDAPWAILVWPIAEGIGAGEIAAVRSDADLASALCAGLARLPIEGHASVAVRVVSQSIDRVHTGNLAVAFALSSMHEAREGGHG
jgi:hypothetical protein